MRCGQCDTFVRAVETWSLGTLVTVSPNCLRAPDWSVCKGDALLTRGHLGCIVSCPPPLPPDIPLQCLRHQVNGFMVTLAWRESLQPIYPVNNFNQIHYPDKSVINCHILHAILFPKFVKESQTMGRVKNSVDSHQSSAQGERRGDRLSL